MHEMWQGERVKIRCSMIVLQKLAAALSNFRHKTLKPPQSVCDELFVIQLLFHEREASRPLTW